VLPPSCAAPHTGKGAPRAGKPMRGRREARRGRWGAAARLVLEGEGAGVREEDGRKEREEGRIRLTCRSCEGGGVRVQRRGAVAIFLWGGVWMDAGIGIGIGISNPRKGNIEQSILYTSFNLSVYSFFYPYFTPCIPVSKRHLEGEDVRVRGVNETNPNSIIYTRRRLLGLAWACWASVFFRGGPYSVLVSKNRFIEAGTLRRSPP
jgi:hypothetical protein